MTINLSASTGIAGSSPILLDHAPTQTRPLRVIRRPVMKRAEVIPSHRHPWPQLTFAVEGVFRVNTPSTTWVVPATRAIWIPSMLEHEVVMLSKVVMHAVRVAEETEGWHEQRVIQVSPLLRECIIALRGSDSEPSPSRSKALSSLILDELKHSQSVPLGIAMPKDRRLRQMCEASIANPSSERTLAEWSRRIGASERTLERRFREELAVSFTQWRQQVRLAHAAALLAQGRSIASTAESVGYRTQSAFTAMFRRAFGQSPREFRKDKERSAGISRANRRWLGKT